MSVKQVIQSESEIAAGQVVEIPFEFADQSAVPKGKSVGKGIVIKPITVRTWFRLKPYLIAIEKEDLDLLIARKESQLFDAQRADLMNKYDSLVFEIVCIGIHNKEGDLPSWFKEVLKDNCTWKDIFILLNAILFRLNFNPFLSSITLLKSVSPLSEVEIIALQKNKLTWNRKAVSCL